MLLSFLGHGFCKLAPKNLLHNSSLAQTVKMGWTQWSIHLSIGGRDQNRAKRAWNLVQVFIRYPKENRYCSYLYASVLLQSPDGQHSDSIHNDLYTNTEGIITREPLKIVLLCQTRGKHSTVCRLMRRRHRLTCKLNRVCVFSMDIKHSYMSPRPTAIDWL